MKINIFWFRRDIRLDDNTALHHALENGLPTLAIFVFDTNIINQLNKDDARISYIYQKLNELNIKLKKNNSSLLILKGNPKNEFEKLSNTYDIDTVYCNKDYEPYARKRDEEIKYILKKKNVKFLSFKDQVVFEEHEIVKADKKPYTVFTPYKKKWLDAFNLEKTIILKTCNLKNLYKTNITFPFLSDIGFIQSQIKVPDYRLDHLKNYSTERDYPSLNSTSHLSTHLRFGTISIRKIILEIGHIESFLSELIWREFFMQILFHFPNVNRESFKPTYENIQWRNNETEFERWCKGETGYPIVDAGMKQLNKSGYMHNRVRMITASFLCKHLLIDWRWGEAYFAERLLDFELSSNNGNWQWAAGSGCDAAPYFRIFNPITQQQKFDKTYDYVKQWIPDFNPIKYVTPIVDHKFARERALSVYKSALNKS